MFSVRVWHPAVQCNECSYPNDDCFQFCQRCGLQRYGSNALRPSSKKFKIDLEKLEARIKDLDSARASTAYQRQKSQLEAEFSGFLYNHARACFPPHRGTLSDFWSGNGKGKTMVHKDSCQFFGLQGKQTCNCPTRLSAGTVDSLIGKLRSIFNALGRTSDRDDRFGSGNPASHLCVKQYLKSIQSEQSQARVSPKQATPVFFDKYKKLVYHLRQLLLGNNISPSERYIYALDLAFFSLDFVSGDRASDLGRINTVDVLKHPDGSSLLFHQRVSKTLRGKTSRAFAVKQTDNPAICPVRNLQFFVELCNSMRLDLSAGFLFRVINGPLLASTVQARLVKYLSSLEINDDETVHGFRSGTSILLRLLGLSREDVAEHIGCRSTALVDYYTQLDKVMSADTSSNTLACSTVDFGRGSSAELLGNTFRKLNCLAGFTQAFL